MNKSKCALYYCGAWGEGFDKIPDRALNCLDILYYSNAAVTKDSVIFNNPAEADTVEILHKRKHGLPVVLSLVGFEDCVSNKSDCIDAAKRACNAALDKGFDGIDLDWEFPTNEQKEMHTLLLKTFREELGKDRIVSVAVPGTNWVFDITELISSHIYLDYINIMTYDIYSERKITSHHCAPKSAAMSPFPCAGLEDNIVLFKEKGIPAEKLIGGVAFYSRIWHNVSSERDGLFAKTDNCADYGPKFCDLTSEFIKNGNFSLYRDESAGGAPYLWNGSDFITFDDEISVYEKCNIIKKYNAGGLMAWEYACDTKENTLLRLMRNGLQ